MTAGFFIIALQVAVVLVTILIAASLLALWKGQYRWHGRINLVVFVLTITAVFGLELVARVLFPEIFSEHLVKHGAEGRLRIHLMFSVPSAVLLPVMLTSGYRRRRSFHIAVGIVFLVLWVGTLVTGLQLPTADL